MIGIQREAGWEPFYVNGRHTGIQVGKEIQAGSPEKVAFLKSEQAWSSMILSVYPGRLPALFGSRALLSLQTQIGIYLVSIPYINLCYCPVSYVDALFPQFNCRLLSGRDQSFHNQ